MKHEQKSSSFVKISEEEKKIFIENLGENYKNTSAYIYYISKWGYLDPKERIKILNSFFLPS